MPSDSAQLKFRIFAEREGRRARIVASSVFRFVAAVSMASLAACAPAKKDQVVKECVLPDDQAGTLTGKWRTTPIPIAFHQGDFSTDEMNAIVRAADTWNEFYGKSLGLATVDYGNGASPRTSSASRPNSSYLCSQGIVSNGGYTGQVVLYKNGAWPFPSQPNAMALTSYCRSSGKPLPYFYMAAIDFNYQNFFVAGKRVPDLQTIILHEFGHMLGLNHSCEGTGRTGVPGCGSSGLDSEYLSAVMFPSFGFDSSGFGEMKRELNSNDQGRANCLYKE